ncbi:MAG: YgcG family protein [Oligoflexales bacterium]
MLAVSTLSSADAQSGFAVPPLVAPVTDQADMISAPAEAALNRVLQTLRDQGGSQIAVLTMPTIGDETIEQASIKIVDNWKLGTKDKDDGALLFVVKDQRAVRIEVGQGLEGDLPDAISKRIIDQTITPMFQQGDIDGGVMSGVYAMASYANPSMDMRSLFNGAAVQSGVQTRAHAPRVPSVVELVILGIVFFFLIFTRTGRMLLLFMLFSGRGGRSYGGGFGGGFGGGDFGGRGGGFSGGGASGRW